MIPLLTREAVRAIDVDARERLGLPTLVLMENAGRAVLELLIARFSDSLARVAIVGGTGQNGGDGWVVARHLLSAGLVPRCVLIGERHKVRGDAAVNLAVLEKMGALVSNVIDSSADAIPELERALGDATLIVDGLFGTGLDRPVAGLYAAVITRINAARHPAHRAGHPQRARRRQRRCSRARDRRDSHRDVRQPQARHASAPRCPARG